MILFIIYFIQFYSSNLFNNPERNCQPACKMEQNDSVESCRIIVGYDDLIVKAFGDKSVLLQKGRFWDFTCSRKLTGEASGNGAVVANTVNDGPEVGNLTTEFSLDITCCDPDDKTCKQVSFTFKEV